MASACRATVNTLRLFVSTIAAGSSVGAVDAGAAGATAGVEAVAQALSNIAITAKIIIDLSNNCLSFTTILLYIKTANDIAYITVKLSM